MAELGQVLCIKVEMFMGVAHYPPVFARIPLLPNNITDEIPPPENLIHHDLEVMSLVVVDGYPDGAVLAQEFPKQHQPGHDHRQPFRVLQAVVVMLESRSRVVGRVDVDAFHPARVERQQRLQRLQVVPLHQQVPLVGAIAPAPRQLRHLVQQPVGHLVRRAQILVSRQPVEQRHARPLLAFFRLTAGSGATLCGEARQGKPNLAEA
tara:strand:- start:3617 stop:4237 length:621 start_codon:yes stop_codon:yes gene_type:complete